MNDPVCDQLNLQTLFLLGQYYRQAECNTGHSYSSRQIIQLLNRYGIYAANGRLATRIAAWIICQNGKLPDADTQLRISHEIQIEVFSNYN